MLSAEYNSLRQAFNALVLRTSYFRCLFPGGLNYFKMICIPFRMDELVFFISVPFTPIFHLSLSSIVVHLFFFSIFLSHHHPVMFIRGWLKKKASLITLLSFLSPVFFTCFHFLFRNLIIPSPCPAGGG